jgi:hypothetical protein
MAKIDMTDQERGEEAHVLAVGGGETVAIQVI